MPNLLKFVTKSVTNFWFGNICPLIIEIKEIIRNVDMKIILTTEWTLGKVWDGIWGNFLVYHIHFSYVWPHINVFFCILVTLTFSSLHKFFLCFLKPSPFKVIFVRHLKAGFLWKFKKSSFCRNWWLSEKKNLCSWI